MHNAVVFTCAVAPGLRFIGRNWSCVTDGSCDAPAGFGVIFPGMVAHGIGMGLEIPLTPADVDAILRLRDMELKRFVAWLHGFLQLFAACTSVYAVYKICKYYSMGSRAVRLAV